jgi:Asp-tRNA(Asn)/Glu-tRNA(Gln) amidotransferase A subunit family amidase
MRGLLRQFLNWLESGEKSAAELLDICLRRIAKSEPELHAWVEVSPQPPLGDGPLGGIPFGAKDIFETRGLATEFGSPIYAGRRGQTDAALVAGLRRRGAVLVGKTQTTAFAYFDPAPTRNPRDPSRTPGGSSSGSAAAVAVGMVPFALGTQTQGSVLRPASFCGIAGFKPTFGLLPLEGVLPFAPSLDTAGLFTENADDMRLLWSRMGFPPATTATRFAAANIQSGTEFRKAAERLGASTIEIPGFGGLLAAARLINDYEGARTHRERWERYGDRLGLKLAQLVERGLRIPSEEYHAALNAVSTMREQMSKLFAEYPVILTPAATGVAPTGLESTGDPRMNSPWTALGVPAISIPLPAGSGLPVGLQLTAERGQDSLLVETAAWVESALMIFG